MGEPQKDASIVIGFRDWGLLRLRLAVESIKQSAGRYDAEVIISDYGSEEPEPNRQLADELGVVYVYTPRTGPWSRSRALNAGFAVSKGRLLVSTDADMIFSPEAFERIIAFSDNNENAAMFLQCRDLPEGMDDEFVAEHPGEWNTFEVASQLRPRWGMGGMMAIPREGFLAIRGFDERLHTYGGEDLDFAQRARRAGYKTQWIDDPGVRMYHMWHTPTSAVVAEDPAATAAVKANRHIVYHDKTYVRNYTNWEFKPNDAQVLVTVAIATRNRADIISDTIYSVLAQTVQDFEIIVVDDGGEDNLEEVLNSFEDSRIKYFKQEPKGISAARNFALDHSQGVYTAVIDDDDLMHPNRLEWHLDAMDEGLSGNVGAFANFDDATGELQLILSKKPILGTAIEDGTSPGHGTWFIKTEVLNRFRYDERLTSGVDHNIYIRMLRSGVNLAHTGKPVTLRRMHPRQVSVTDRGNQRGAASFSTRFLQFGTTGYYLKKLKEDVEKQGAYQPGMKREEFAVELTPYLPDNLVTRDVLIQSAGRKLKGINTDGQLESLHVFVDDQELTGSARIRNASYADLAKLRKRGISFQAASPAGSVELQELDLNWMKVVESFIRDETDEAPREWIAYAEYLAEEPLDYKVRLVTVDIMGEESQWLVLRSNDDAEIEEFMADRCGFVRGSAVFGGDNAI